MRILFTFLLFTLFIFSCSDEKKADDNSPNSVEKRIKKKKKAQPLDSISRKNTVAFLAKYGQENKENKVVIHTRFGDIRLVLYNETPLHRANFIFPSKIGYFDPSCF